MSKIIDTFLGKIGLQKKETGALTSSKLVEMFSSPFLGSADPRLNDTYMACVHTHARHAAKMKPIATLNGLPADSKKYLTYLLSEQPNKLQTAAEFWESVANDYWGTNLAIIYIQRDEWDYRNPIKSLWCLDPDYNHIDIKSYNGELYLSFTLNSKEVEASFDDVCIIPRNSKASDIFGSGNDAVTKILDLMSINYQGIEKAIKTSALLRFLIQTTTPLNETLLEKKAEYFSKTFLSNENAKGVAYIDAAASVTQVNNQNKYLDAETVKLFDDKIYRYQGMSERIVTGSFTEDEWQAYYESAQEPFVIKVQQSLSTKIYSKDEISRGNRITIRTDALQTASLNTRTKIAMMVMKLPVYKPNTVLDLLYLERTPSGDKEYANLNYVEADKQNEYQNVSDSSNDDKGVESNGEDKA